MKLIFHRVIPLLIILCMALPALAFCDSEPVTSVMFSGTDAVIDGEGAKLKKDCLSISKGGCYTLTGSFSGRVKVDAAGQKVVLTLAGADISSEDKCPLLIKEASSAVLILQDGTENRLYSGINAENDEDTEADGSEEEGKGANALKCGCPLRIEGGGCLEMTSGKNGISGKKSVTVADGKLLITCGNDGIHLSDAEEESVLSVEGGYIGITCDGDGMQADTVSVSGGAISIVCGGGSENAAPRSDGFGGRPGGMWWGGRDTDTENAEAGCKGIKAVTLIEISGGSIAVDAQDDAIHCNDRIFVSGGETVLSAGDDGIHADTYLEISKGLINITDSYEGLEAHHIEISGGDISVKASDDGMNANGGSNSFGFGGPGGGRGGWGGFDRNSRNSSRGSRGRTEAAPQPESTQQPGGYQMPGGMQFPNGMTPPDGMQMPDGMTPPDGVQMPDGMTPPDGMQMPDGMQFPGMANGQQPDSGEKDSENTEDEMLLLHISGGNIKVDASGDGLDSNGDLIIDGGDILVFGPTNGGNGALDSGMENGGILRISGGTVLAFGAADMAESFDESSAQPSVTYTSNTRFSAGTVVTLTDEGGNVLYQAVLSKTGNSVILSTPDMEIGKTFTLKINAVTETFTIEDTVTYLGKGRPYSGFGGGFGW